MALLWFSIGLAGIVYGVFRVMRERDRVDSLILGGAFVDVGFVVVALGTYADAGYVGMALTLVYQSLVRYVAYMALCRLAPLGTQPCLTSLQGLVTSRPRLTVLLCFTLVAALGVSPVMTLEGRNFVLYALACNGGLWMGAVLAIPYTILAWLTAKVVLTTCFTPVLNESAGALRAGAAGTIEANQGFNDGIDLSAASDSAGHATAMGTTMARPTWLYVGAVVLLLFGLARDVFVHVFNEWFGGPGLPVLESAWPLAVSIMYIGAFPLLCRKPSFEPWRTGYAVLLSLAGLIGVLWSDFTPLVFMFSLIITGMGVLVVVYSTAYIENTRRKPAYWFFLAITFASLLGIVTSSNAGTFVTFWELMSWASFLLIAWEQNDKARAAALKYLVICVGVAHVLVPALFALSDSDALLTGASLSTLPQSTLLWALLLALVGFAAKAGLVPLHGWLPDAHPAAPSSVSAPLSGVLTKVGLFGVVLVFFVLAGDGQLSRAGTGYAGLSLPGLVLTTLGLLTMLYGEYKALQQDDVKRLLAYSTMGQVGEIATVLGLGTWLSTTGALAHVFNHAIMKDLLFLCAGALILRTRSRKLPDLAGLARIMPWTVGCMLVGLVSIMGLPPFNGFISKYLMIIACLDAGYPKIAVALLGASLAGAVYYMRVLRVLVFDAPLPQNVARMASYTDVPWPMRVPLVILAGLCVFLGIVPQAGLALITPVADALAGQGQLAMGNLPALSVAWPVYVIVPMLGAVLPIVFRADHRKAGRATALVLAVTTLLVPLFGQTLDTLSFGMALIIPAVGAVNMVYAVGYMEHSHTQWRFYTFFLLMTGGLLGVAASTDLFSFFTFWEIMSSWALYFAIAHEGSPEAVREAFKYFLFNVAGAACLFLGIGIIVAKGGTSNFSEVGAALLGLSSEWGTAVMALMALGFTMKAAQLAVRIDWQMHPDLAPTPVSGYISSVLLKIAVFGMVKLFLEFGGVHLRIPDATDLFNQALIMNLVAWAGALTLLFAAFKAMFQERIKMVFIWSTVSQIGYMVLSIAMGTSLGLAGGLMHLTSHVFFKDLLFFTAGAVMLQTHQSSITQLGGIGRRMPVTMACFALGALTAVGMPPTVGFTSKWIIYQALMEQGEVLLALMSLVGSVVTLAYFARFVHLVFLGCPTQHTETITDAPLVMRASMLVLAAITVLVGIFPGLFLWPINQVVVEYGLPALDVALWGLVSGPGAWNATLMSVLVITTFGALWWGLHRVMRTLPERRLDPHSCGVPPTESISPQRAESLYAALVAVQKERGSC